MIYCSECGTRNKMENNFCKKCGQKIKVISSDEDKNKRIVQKLEEEIRELKREKILREKEFEEFEQKNGVGRKRRKRKENVEIVIEEEAIEEIKKDISKDIKEEVIKEVSEEVKNELAYTMEIVGLTKKKKKRTSSPLLILLMVITLAGGYFYFSYLQSPKKIVETYFETLISKDYEELYNFVEMFGDTTFVNKNYYIELLKENIENNGIIVDYDIKNVDYSKDKSKAFVDVDVIYDTESGRVRKNAEIKFSRDDEKLYVIFNNWNMVSHEQIGIDVISDYIIKVPKDSEVVFDKIKLESKYLQEDNNTVMDVYKLPQIFEKEVEIKVTLANGDIIEKEILPSKYYKEYTLDIEKDDVSSKEIEKIENNIKFYLEKLLISLENKVSFNSIKEDFLVDDKINSLVEKYEEYASFIKDKKYNLKDFKVKNISISSIKFNYLFNFVVDAKVDYDWGVLESNKNKTSSGFGYYTFYFAYKDGKYMLVDISQIPMLYF